jgi:hypothetical protein
VKKPKLLLAALLLLLGAAAAAGLRFQVALAAGSIDPGESAMLTVKSGKGRS